MDTTQKLASLSVIYPVTPRTRVSIPVLATKLHAGFPSPAEHYIAKGLDLNEYVVRNKTYTHFSYMEGDSMIGENIVDGDLIVIEKTNEARNKDIVVVRFGEEYCIRRYRVEGNRKWFEAANPEYPPIEVNERNNPEIWGLVTFSLRKH